MQNTFPDDDPVQARVVDLVSRSARLLDPGEELALDRELLDAGVDSFGLLELITSIELEFDIAIPDEMLTRETFQSARSVTELVRQMLAGASA
jgi:acyl carrier protein